MSWQLAHKLEEQRQREDASARGGREVELALGWSKPGQEGIDSIFESLKRMAGSRGAPGRSGSGYWKQRAKNRGAQVRLLFSVPATPAVSPMYCLFICPSNVYDLAPFTAPVNFIVN